MKHAAFDEAEVARLQALENLHILDTPPEAAFDDLAWLAGTICETPISLISLVCADRLWFKARCGIDVDSAPRSVAFCSHAIQQDDILEIYDARLDERFADYPAITGAPHVRFYAGAPLTGASGHRYGTLCVMDTESRMLTDRQREALKRLASRAADTLEMRLQHIQERGREAAVSELLEVLPDGVVSCDRDGRLKEFNGTARDWHGVDPRALPPEQWSEHFGLYDEKGESHLKLEEIPLRRAFNGEKVRAQPIVIRVIGKEPRTVSCNANPLLGLDGRTLGAVCTMHDVTARTHSSRLLEQMALTDELTGLPNRAAWFRELDRAVGRAQRAGHAAVVMFTDLNDFKSINDGHGHAVGDEVLKEFSRRLTANCRRNDFVARLAGDEFVAYLDQANPSPEELCSVATKIRDAMSVPIRVGTVELIVGCSIGFATEQGKAIDGDRLLHNADVAMYAAKRERQFPFVLIDGGTEGFHSYTLKIPPN